MTPLKHPHAFTLIELLIVVAIIAILAAIALPNFLEAQMRAKVTRTKADMRTVAVGLEAYAVDQNWYPPMYVYRRGFATRIYLFVPNVITTPVAYLSTKGILLDPFKQSRPNNAFVSGSFDPRHLDYYNYINAKHIGQFDNIQGFSPFPPTPREEYIGEWELWSYGPDEKAGPEVRAAADNSVLYVMYDPTNGTRSEGDIRRTQDNPEGRIATEEVAP